MLTIQPARSRPANRVASQSDKQPSAQNKTYLPPVLGLVTNRPQASNSEGSAIVLENFWPTASGIEPRGGTVKRCTIAGAVERLFQYRAGFSHAYFAADNANVYEFSSITSGTPALTASITGQTSADYSIQETQTDGGSFLTIVNGHDPAQIYDGDNWQQVTATTTPFAITGIDTDRLTDIWAYRNRTFFIERGTMNAWYLGINSVSGHATKLPLAGVFNKGGSLMFGATWSSDSGAGMDDRCVFVTDQGEFAIYSGGNPGDAADWHSNGVYDLGVPLGKNCTMSVGGDLIVATKAGLIPLSAAINKDVTELKLVSLSKNIEPDWHREVVLGGSSPDWRLVKWGDKNGAVICPPQGLEGGGYCYAVNLETGAWTKFTGWQIGAMAVLGDTFYYGDHAGNILETDNGGTDDGVPFECRACFAFDDLGQPAALKTVHAMRGMWQHRGPIKPRHSVAADYKPDFPNTPSASPLVTNGHGDWDVSEWDKTFWATEGHSVEFQEKWQPVSAHGKTIAVQCQIISSASYKLDCGLVSIDVTYTTGGVLV